MTAMPTRPAACKHGGQRSEAGPSESCVAKVMRVLLLQKRLVDRQEHSPWAEVDSR